MVAEDQSLEEFWVWGECGSGLAWPLIWQFGHVVDASCTGWWVVAGVVENLKKMLGKRTYRRHRECGGDCELTW